MDSNIVLLGDCLEVMKAIPDKSIDAIITDLPYGTTHCKWDTVIPFEPLWAQYNRIAKDGAAIVLFGNEPFTSALISSNFRGFKYRIDWNKKIPSGFSYAKYRPMQQTEDICVFTACGEKTNYNPQMTKRQTPIKAGGNNLQSSIYGKFNRMSSSEPYNKTYTHKFPTTLIEFEKVRRGGLHATQKPVPLLEYLIKTYTNEGDIVLDSCAGSGTTGVACQNTNRNYILIEKEQKYIDIIKERLEQNYRRINENKLF